MLYCLSAIKKCHTYSEWRADVFRSELISRSILGIGEDSETLAVRMLFARISEFHQKG